MSPHIARVVLFVLSGRCDLEWRLLVVHNVRIRISSSQCNIATPLRGSHSVTCHPTEVTFPLLPQPKLVLSLATRGMLG